MPIDTERNFQANNSSNMPLRYYLEQHKQAFIAAMKNLISSPFKTIFAILLLTILLILPSGFWLFYKNIQATAHSWENSSKLIVYLTVNTSEQQAKDLQAQINERGDVAKTVYISPLDGVKELVQQLDLGDLLAKLPFNPLPAVIEILPSASVTSLSGITKLGDELKALPEVASLQMNLDAAKRQYAYLALWGKIVHTVMAVSAIALVLAIAFVLQVFFHSSNSANAENAAISRKQAFYTGIILGLLTAIVTFILLLVWFNFFGEAIKLFFGENIVAVKAAFLPKLLLVGLVLCLSGTWVARRFSVSAR